MAGNNLANSNQLSGLRFSLRNLLVFVTFFSVACIALKYAGQTWWLILSSVSMLLFMAVIIVALVGHGEQRAFAIGFVACAMIYGSLVLAGGSNELDFLKGRLPTTKALHPVFRLIAKGRWIDLTTGKEVPNYTPPGGFGGGAMGGGFSSGTATASYSESPPREQFIAIGHVLWTNLLSWIGGLFACFVYARRERVNEAP